ncbi:hypothetical protein CAPTEDRAFT_190396 [Capitella teleta]|uniref:F5/8 type C domain-containing protein n=1 Tax=Capitella teleta TaxID=283909 RepID=R7U8X6_CAPTE|nr:hypothetical protein CAPTEDRAFT_190396 [Capitella teleta]|eukprot:ELU02586.1 hypothetical protein CAPTEDRAFT_190396 [Capitella teleta]
MDTALTTAVILYLVLRHEVAPTSASCHCGGFAPLITDVDNAQVFASPHETHHSPARSKNSGESWWAKNYNGSFDSPWIGVDFTTNRIIAGVATSSSFDADGVETFSIDYRLDGSDIWINHTDADGNITVNTADHVQQIDS